MSSRPSSGRTYREAALAAAPRPAYLLARIPEYDPGWRERRARVVGACKALVARFPGEEPKQLIRYNHENGAHTYATDREDVWRAFAGLARQPETT